MMHEGKSITTAINSATMKGDDDINRISNLPDSILTNILARLNSHEMMQTCVLSKRWCKLWAFVPCLQINYDEFKRTSETETRNLKRFENFVSSFLRLRDDATDLHSFAIWHTSLYTRATVPGSTATEWALYAAKHNPKDLRINLYGQDQIRYPDCLFTCASLKDLHLECEVEEDWVEFMPDKIVLPKLRHLLLNDAFISGDSMEKLLVGCPVLKHLSLNDCLFETNSISFQTLKSLDMNNCYFGKDVFHSTYTISAPRVECLYFSAQIGTGAKLTDMPMLTEAHITADVSDRNLNYDLELLGGLFHVENLNLRSVLFKEMLEAELSRCRTFYNLKKLYLSQGCMFCHFHLVSSFLDLCPSLEHLTLWHHEKNWEIFQNGHIQEEQSQNSEQPENFACHRLRKINIFYSKGDRKVDRLVALLLKKTMGISDLKITLSRNSQLPWATY